MLPRSAPASLRHLLRFEAPRPGNPADLADPARLAHTFLDSRWLFVGPVPDPPHRNSRACSTPGETWGPAPGNSSIVFPRPQNPAGRRATLPRDTGRAYPWGA